MQFPERLFFTPAWRQLSPSQRLVLIDLYRIAQTRGVAMEEEFAVRREDLACPVAESAYYAALGVLKEKWFITRPRSGVLTILPPMAILQG